jgi:predicted DCC family thiol-disulfide oxidoreductase YuxK
MRSRLTVLYDRDCGLCIATARKLHHWDRLDRFDVRPLQEAALPKEALLDALHVIDADTGRVHAGGDAVLAIVAGLPGGRAFSPFAGWPHVRWLAGLVYDLVAANRGRISRWLDLDQLCETTAPAGASSADGD